MTHICVSLFLGSPQTSGAQCWPSTFQTVSDQPEARSHLSDRGGGPTAAPATFLKASTPWGERGLLGPRETLAHLHGAGQYQAAGSARLGDPGAGRAAEVATEALLNAERQTSIFLSKSSTDYAKNSRMCHWVKSHLSIVKLN